MRRSISFKNNDGLNPGHVSEYEINVRLAEILSREFGIDARAERAKGKRPDIRCYYKGLIIGIESSYDKNDAEEDAKRRIEQGLADMTLALWLKRRYPDVPEERLEALIRKSRFDVKIFVPVEIMGTLIPFLEREIKKGVEPATGWFEDVDILTIKTILENSISFMIKEKEIQELIDDLKQRIDDFIITLRELDINDVILKRVYGILYKLYGLSIAEARDPEIAFGHAALSIILSTTFYEHIRDAHPDLNPIMDYIKRYGYIEGLRRALEDLLKIDYRVAVETTIKILECLPSGITRRLKDLIELGIKMASNKGLLRKDFAGRVYHEITGDIALRKGFATFYTEIPAAYMLATLATQALLEIDKENIFGLTRERAQELIQKMRDLKIGDLACGSGTLLTASYYSFHRVAAALKYYYDMDHVDLTEIDKLLIENSIYGVDALRYASQITAINLALIGPSKISRENVYTIYLGYIPETNQAWLGSLELLNNGGRVGGLLTWIEGGLKGVAEKVSLKGTEEVLSMPSKFHVIIMNPPFTRATGRTEKFEEASMGGRGLFGFMVDEEARQRLLEAYRGIRNRIRNELRSIANSAVNILPDVVKDIVIHRPRELQQYLSIGQAGEGLLFLYLAYKYIKDGGVIAFVLPRGALAGVSWLLARILLASKFHLKYVVVSSDPERGYNFSEGAALSETLIVAKRTDKHSHDEETLFINLLQKPSSALEAMMLSEEIKRITPLRKISLIEIGKAKALTFKIKRDQLVNNIDNWNRFVAIPNARLLDTTMYQLLKGNIFNIKVPITRFNNILSSLGIDAHQFHDHFRQVRTATAYPLVFSGREEVRRKMLVQPNAYAFPKTSRSEEIFRNYSGRLLVPDRIWWDTAHVVALYSEEPVLSNIFYAIRLKAPPEIKNWASKVLTLWFNTVWGLLTVLISRQETRGRWSRLKMAQWRLLPVLDIRCLDQDVIRRLARVFDEYADRPLRRIPDQFDPKNPDPIRLGIDINFLKAMNPAMDEVEIKSQLLELYKHIKIAMQLWIMGSGT